MLFSNTATACAVGIYTLRDLRARWRSGARAKGPLWSRRLFAANVYVSIIDDAAQIPFNHPAAVVLRDAVPPWNIIECASRARRESLRVNKIIITLTLSSRIGYYYIIYNII